MPMKKSPNGGGSNADGSLNLQYCAYCYEAGQFKQPDWDVYQMETFVADKLKEMKFPGFLARLFAKRIHKLERWQHS